MRVLNSIEHNRFGRWQQALLASVLFFPLCANNPCVDLINQAGARDWRLEGVSPQTCPLSQDFVRWMSLRDYPTRHTLADYARFIDAHPQWPRLSELRRRAEQRLSTAQNNVQLLQWFEKNPPLTASAHIVFLKTLQEQKSTTHLKSQTQHVWRTVFMPLAERQWVLKNLGTYLDTQDFYVRYRMAIKARNFEEAEKLLPKLPASDQEAARYRLQLVSGKIAFQDLPARYQTNSKFIVDHLNTLKKKDPQAAIDLFLKTKNQIRAHASFALTLYIAREAIHYDQPQKAYCVMQDHPFEIPIDVVQAEEFLAWVACDLLKRPQDALPHLDRIRKVAVTPRTLSRAAFWTGRCYDAMGDKGHARQWYETSAQDPLSFYGQMGLKKLGRSIDMAHWDKRAPSHYTHVQGHPFIALARVVADSKFADQANHFVRVLLDRACSEKERYDILDVAAGISPTVAVAAGRALSRCAPVLDSKAYPMKWGLDQKEIPHSLVLGLIRQESSFDPQAVSGAGAIGLMQLLPSTGKRMAQRLGLSEPDLTNPKLNVRLGCHYLNKHLEEFCGHWVPTIASYNAGPKPVRRWIEHRGHPPALEDLDGIVRWIEMIPYGETRNYVQYVLANHEVYHHLIAHRVRVHG